MAIPLQLTHLPIIILEAHLVAKQRQINRLLYFLHAFEVADIALRVDAAWTAISQG